MFNYGGHEVLAIKQAYINLEIRGTNELPHLYYSAELIVYIVHLQPFHHASSHLRHLLRLHKDTLYLTEVSQLVEIRMSATMTQMGWSSVHLVLATIYDLIIQKALVLFGFDLDPRLGIHFL